MRRYDFPAAPVLIGMILGPLAEEQMRRSLSISQGNPLVFFERPLSGSILVLAIAILVGPWLWKTLRKRNK